MNPVGGGGTCPGPGFGEHRDTTRRVDPVLLRFEGGDVVVDESRKGTVWDVARGVEFGFDDGVEEG